MSASGRKESVFPDEHQEVPREQFFADAFQWWDDRRSNLPSRRPDFRHPDSKSPLCVNNRHKPVSVDSQLATIDAGLKMTLEAGFSIARGSEALSATETRLDIAMCWKLCEDGLTSDAVDALDQLVQRGCVIPSKLFYRLLRRCIQNKDFVSGRCIHALIVSSGYEGDAFLATHLIGFYASHSRLEEAMKVFDKVPRPDAYNWATIIFAYARHGGVAEALEAIRLYRHMCDSSTVKPDNCLYVAVLKACAAAKDLIAGREVHASVMAMSRKPDRFVQAGLVNMYAKCGSLDDARRLFDTLLDKDVVAWTSMIAGYAQQGMGLSALSLYSSMQQQGLIADAVTYVCLLQACACTGVGALPQGKQLHVQIDKRGLGGDFVLCGSLVNMYAKCGSLEDARRLFDKLPHRNVVAWNAMLGGYSQQGRGKEALLLYRGMQREGLRPDSVTYASLLQACAAVGTSALNEGKQLHVQIGRRGLEEDAILGRSLVHMYAKCGGLEDARKLFDKLADRNIVAWNAIIAGYAQQGRGGEALSLYSNMQKEGVTPDSVTFLCLLQACAIVGVGALHVGKQLHAHMEDQGLEEDPVLSGSLINMYVRCGRLGDARKLLDKLPQRSIVAWNAMVAGYAQQGMGQEALRLYSSMHQEGLIPDSVTYVCLLQACAALGVTALYVGRQLHMQIEEQGLGEDAVLGGSLISMYAKCGGLEDARRLFDKLVDRNTVAWNAMIAGYAQQGMGQEALSLYSSMQRKGLAPSSVTYVCLLQACAAVAALPLGERLHAEIEERGMQVDSNVGAALVNMYAKCGSMCNAQQVLDALSDQSIEAWNALVSGYARQGDSQVVFDLLLRMRLEGMHPNEITLLGVLTVCSHVGLVDKGREYFEAMRSEYGISATMEHYICMVDLLGRAGHVHEALEMIGTMPFSPNDAVWHTLLSACWKWKNLEIGQQAFRGAVSVDEKDAAAYVLMSNIYASNQMSEAAKEMKARRMKLGAWKKPGQSWWTDMGGVVHTFLVGDKVHPESEGIYRRLEQLIPKLKKEGYVPHLESSLLDISDDNKFAELCGHSEKLAIAYALNKTAEGTTIRIVKNLRVCEDCHTATAYISKVEKRTIICRDGSRFHVFKEGKCSCGDYW